MIVKTLIFVWTTCVKMVVHAVQLVLLVLFVVVVQISLVKDVNIVIYLFFFFKSLLNFIFELTTFLKLWIVLQAQFCEFNICQNGNCTIEPSGLITCKCFNGFIGTRCEFESSICAQKTCNNHGLCMSRGGGAYECLCDRNPNTFFFYYDQHRSFLLT